MVNHRTVHFQLTYFSGHGYCTLSQPSICEAFIINYMLNQSPKQRQETAHSKPRFPAPSSKLR